MPFIKILDGTNVPSIGTLYKKGDVVTTKHGRNTKVIVYLNLFISETNYYQLTVKYDKLTNNTPKLTALHEYFDDVPYFDSGYYIFTDDYSGQAALPSNLSKNNISMYYNGN